MKHLPSSTRTPAWALLALVAGGVSAGLSAAGSANAQDCGGEDCVAAYTIDGMPEIQSSNSVFKFQARISQAKMPVGEAEFDAIIVNLLAGSEQIASETLPGPQVRDSILNLEIGAGMPDLNTAIAEHSDLAFQICINNLDNCLKPVALAHVPYAVKSEYSLKSEMAQRAQVAAQCHYSHRATADANLFTSEASGIGYYDFHTPTNVGILDIEPTSVNLGDGYLQWTAVGSQDKMLNVCAKDAETGRLVELDELRLHAALTRLRGELRVEEPAQLDSTLDVDGAAQLFSTLDVTGATSLHNTLQVDLGATIDAYLNVTGPVDVTGAAELHSTLNVLSGMSTFSDVTINGTTAMGNLTGAVDLTSGSLTTASGVSTTFNGMVHFNGGATGLALGSTDIDTNAIGHEEIQTDAVRAAEIQAGAVGSSEIATDAVGSDEIANDAVGKSEIASNVVGATELEDGYFEVTTGNTLEVGYIGDEPIAFCMLEGMRCLSSSSACRCEVAPPQSPGSRVYTAVNATCYYRCIYQ